MTYHEILFPTDGSEASLGALEHALDLAQRYGARLHVIYVVDTSYPYGEFDGVGVNWESVIDQVRSEGHEVVTTVRNHAEDTGLDVVTEVLDDEVIHRAILTYTDSAEIDLIVMGTHGRRGVNRLLLGSVTERVVRAADVPVLTVKQNHSSK